MPKKLAHIGECPLGVFAFDESGEMVGSQIFPKEMRSIAARVSSIRKGEPVEEHYELLRDLHDRGYRKFSTESESLASVLEEDFEGAEFEVRVPNKASKILRNSLSELSDRYDFGDLDELLRDLNFLLTREGVRHEASKRDGIVIETIKMLDELDKIINALYARVREWYGIHFPELERYVSECPQYLDLVSRFGPRKNFIVSDLKGVGLSDEDSRRIARAAESSIGADFDEMDIEILRECVKKIDGLHESRKRVAEYLDGLMFQVAPNIRALVGSPIGARLISLAGGLIEMAKMPASTIQVLGAEKALFRALHGRGKPPKHGVIYQYPGIKGAPRKQRGKIARMLAGKLAIAARVDAMSGSFVGDELKEDLEEKIALVKSKGKGSRVDEDKKS